MGALKMPHRHIAIPLGLLQQSGVAHGFFAECERGARAVRETKRKHISHEDARPSTARGKCVWLGDPNNVPLWPFAC